MLHEYQPNIDIPRAVSGSKTRLFAAQIVEEFNAVQGYGRLNEDLRTFTDIDAEVTALERMKPQDPNEVKPVEPVEINLPGITGTLEGVLEPNVAINTLQQAATVYINTLPDEAKDVTNNTLTKAQELGKKLLEEPSDEARMKAEVYVQTASLIHTQLAKRRAAKIRNASTGQEVFRASVDVTFSNF